MKSQLTRLNSSGVVIPSPTKKRAIKILKYALASFVDQNNENILELIKPP